MDLTSRAIIEFNYIESLKYPLPFQKLVSFLLNISCFHYDLILSTTVSCSFPLLDLDHFLMFIWLCNWNIYRFCDRGLTIPAFAAVLMVQVDVAGGLEVPRSINTRTRLIPRGVGQGTGFLMAFNRWHTAAQLSETWYSRIDSCSNTPALLPLFRSLLFFSSCLFLDRSIPRVLSFSIDFSNKKRFMNLLVLSLKNMIIYYAFQCLIRQ